jgi:hypothetical protein
MRSVGQGGCNYTYGSSLRRLFGGIMGSLGSFTAELHRVVVDNRWCMRKDEVGGVLLTFGAGAIKRP